MLAEPIGAAVERARNAFDSAASPFERRLVLFGAGGFGRQTLQGLRQCGLEPLAFADNNSQLWGKTVEGIPVYSPKDAATKFAAFQCTLRRHHLEWTFSRTPWLDPRDLSLKRWAVNGRFQRLSCFGSTPMRFCRTIHWTSHTSFWRNPVWYE